MRFAPYPGLADDIVQQVFLEFIAKQDQWKLGDDPRPLLAVMTRNVAKRLWQEKTRKMPEILRKIAERVQSLAEQRTDSSSYDDELFALQFCLDRLSERERALLEKRYYQKHPSQKIADEMGLRVNTLNRAICRIREKLRLCIERKTRIKTAQ